MKVFDADKTRMIGLPWVKKNCDNKLSRFYRIQERNGQTDGRRTDRHLLCQYRASASVTRDKTVRSFPVL